MLQILTVNAQIYRAPIEVFWQRAFQTAAFIFHLEQKNGSTLTNSDPAVMIDKLYFNTEALYKLQVLKVREIFLL